MKLIVGLGNPGILYGNSRHNIGFLSIKHLAKEKRIALKKEKGISALSGKGKIENDNCLVAVPLTFMNLSGEAVKPLLKKYKIGLEDLLVICDDLDLDFGRIKLRPNGSSAGHRGIQSIINSLKTNEFNRLRVGIGRPRGKLGASEFVLSHFNRREKEELKGIIPRVSLCVQSWINEDVEKSMNIFNRKDRQ
ncbi:MAG: aminoacyl-tRNA hydrolase [Candidatus Omnitrophica bacterium]|nr:aminoacyl-tRNA hydrolase [Candidatus Omnitrophota bacterium]